MAKVLLIGIQERVVGHTFYGCDSAGQKSDELFCLDMNRDEDFFQLFRTLESRKIKIDHVINCAYPRNERYGAPLEDVSLDSFNENVALHLGGYFNVMKHMCGYFKKQGGGGIINFSSIYGQKAPDFSIYPDGMTMPVEYAAIKSGVDQLSKYFLTYFKGNNIRINVISPGGVFDMQPPSFVNKYNALCINDGMLDDGALITTVEYLLSEGSRFVNGQNIGVDDGFKL